MEQVNYHQWQSDVDMRYNDYHIIDQKPTNWSRDWQEFPGLSYIPFVTQWEESVINEQRMVHLQKFMRTYWHYSVYISLVYIALIPVLQRWIKSRGQPFKLRGLLITWNTFLAVFSIIGVIRCLPELVHIVVTKGFTATYCQSDYYRDPRLQWWYLLFVCSKVIELVDTLFIVLRGGKLIALHWVHHCLTLCYSWYAFGDVPASARWMVNMNFVAHSLMYSYYALKAAKIAIPVAISVAITSVQIMQMIAGLYITYRVQSMKRSGIRCDGSYSVSVTGLSLYSLFFILFVNFFVKTYVIKDRSKSHPNEKSD